MRAKWRVCCGAVIAVLALGLPTACAAPPTQCDGFVPKPLP